MFRKVKAIGVSAVLAGAVIIAACTNESKENIIPDTSGNNCDTTNITYTGFVKGIMDASCATSGCHDASSHSSGVDLSDYAGVKNTATTMKNNMSLLLGAINHESGFNAMPQGAAKLSECTINKITAWVNAGEPE